MANIDALLDKVMDLCPLAKSAEVFESQGNRYLSMTVSAPAHRDDFFLLAGLTPLADDEVFLDPIADMVKREYDWQLEHGPIEDPTGGYLFGPFYDAVTLGSRRRV